MSSDIRYLELDIGINCHFVKMHFVKLNYLTRHYFLCEVKIRYKILYQNTSQGHTPYSKVMPSGLPLKLNFYEELFDGLFLWIQTTLSLKLAKMPTWHAA